MFYSVSFDTDDTVVAYSRIRIRGFYSELSYHGHMVGYRVLEASQTRGLVCICIGFTLPLYPDI